MRGLRYRVLAAAYPYLAKRVLLDADLRSSDMVQFVGHTRLEGLLPGTIPRVGKPGPLTNLHTIDFLGTVVVLSGSGFSMMIVILRYFKWDTANDLRGYRHVVTH